MPEIPLTKGLVALVDDRDIEFLSQWKWTAANKGSRGRVRMYAVRKHQGRHRSMAKEVYERHHGPVPEGFVLDHHNENSLDNRDENIRPITHLENMRKTGKWRRGSNGVFEEGAHLVAATLSEIDF